LPANSRYYCAPIQDFWAAVARATRRIRRPARSEGLILVLRGERRSEP
jgi:hypothetical protein